jgi:hypothetical protein
MQQHCKSLCLTKQQAWYQFAQKNNSNAIADLPAVAANAGLVRHTAAAAAESFALLTLCCLQVHQSLCQTVSTPPKDLTGRWNQDQNSKLVSSTP